MTYIYYKLYMDNANIKDIYHIKMKHINTLFQYIKNRKDDQFLEYISNLNQDEIDFNTKDEQNNYLLFFAVIMNNRKILKKMMEYDIRFDILDTEGYSILYHPIKFDYREITDILLTMDKKLVGISIKDMRDSKGNVPIFYAIRYNNHHALEELLNVNVDVNYKNNKHINALHLAVMKKDSVMVKMIIKYIKNINAKTLIGDTALHYACSYQLYDIIKILLNAGADPNISESEHELYPIFYSVIQNDIDIVELLIKAKFNPNNQDNNGSTIIHYAIVYNHISILDFLFNYFDIQKHNYSTYVEDISREDISQDDTILINNKYTIDPNLVNIDGLTILHLLLYNYKSIYDKYIEKLLRVTNINYQDNSGNTVCHILMENDKWGQFESILINKSINIYIKNNKGKNIIDMVHINSREKFLTMITTSYFNYLKSKNTEWQLDWQNKCGIGNENLMDESICKKYIRESILLNKLSIPQKKNKQTIILDLNKMVQFTTFTGSLLDMISGFVYLMQKHTHVTTIFDIDNLNGSYGQYGQEFDKYNNSLGISTESDKHLIRFEIMWLFQQLYFPPNFKNILEKIITEKKYGYIIIPIGIILSNGNHSNAILYDIENNIIERFEPHGYGYPYKFNYNPDLLDELLYSKINNIINDIYQKDIIITYIKPNMYLPKIGFQTFDDIEAHVNKNIGDPNGFCALWCIWYLDYRLTYIKMTPRKIIKKLIKQIRLSNLSFRDIIRNYSKKITDFRDTYLTKINKNINDYLNNTLTEIDYKVLMKEILKSINS